MEDIAPKLLETIREHFHGNMESDSQLQTLLQAIQDSLAAYPEASQYADLVGQSLAKAFGEILSSEVLPDGRMYYNIAQRVLPPMLREDYDLVTQAVEQVQAALNEAAGIAIKPQLAPFNADRVSGLVNKVANSPSFDDVAWVLDEPIRLFSMMVVDECLKANVDFHGQAGLSPRVIRKARGKCCPWCAALVGEYEYPKVPEDVYRRHENCRCSVEYDPADGSRRRQNVWSKEWTADEERDKIEVRKTIGVSSTVVDITHHPKRLASFSPSSLKEALEKDGMEVKPLGRGGLKGIPFEEGGGYRVNFEDGGLFQYHPEIKSHHVVAYYKISTGKGGVRRYDLEGNEI